MYVLQTKKGARGGFLVLKTESEMTQAINKRHSPLSLLFVWVTVLSLCVPVEFDSAKAHLRLRDCTFV